MVSNLEEWPNFQPELSEFAELRKSFSEFVLIYRPQDTNKKQIYWHKMPVYGKQYSIL